MLTHDLSLEADELLNTAIMSETSIIIVEGIDDIKIYQNISESIDKNIDVYASENIKDIDAGGCRGVLECLKKIYQNHDSHRIKEYILGIIDRDSRYYRGEIEHFDALLILEFYSIESHFVNHETICDIVSSSTRANSKLFDNNTAISLFESLKEQLGHLYYISLEALKNACVESYTGKIGYRMKIQEIKSRNLHNFNEDHIKELDSFAIEKGIKNNWENLLEICKGKWLVQEFSIYLRREISKLTNMCNIGAIKKCQYCINETPDKCLYKTTTELNDSVIQSLLINNIKISSLNYIRDRINQLH